MRAVLDTNIVIDLLHFADPQTLPLRQAIARGTLHCFTDRPCLAELQRVSGYPQFGLDAAAQALLLHGYRSFVTRCEPEEVEDYRLPRCRDADDQKFLILGMRCRGDLLITRDRRLLQLARQRRLPLPFAIVTASAAGGLIAESQTASIA
jgi:putative PIN family toxin of toxin-antitoxin system